MQLTQEQISQAVASAMPDVLAGLRKEIAESALAHAKAAAHDAVRKAVGEWVVAELIPDINKALIESKAGLTAFAPKLAEELTGALSAACAETLKKKLENSWERQAIFKALLT
jgi:hypothetical protein